MKKKKTPGDIAKANRQVRPPKQLAKHAGVERTNMSTVIPMQNHHLTWKNRRPPFLPGVGGPGFLYDV
jgi:hypothetical protein